MPVVSQVASRISLELEGAACGALAYAAGGDLSAPVDFMKLGQDPTPRKHLGTAAPEPLQIRFGVPMGQALHDWIAAAWAGAANARRNGAVVVADAAGKEHARHAFGDALIVETSFPKLDASSKDVYLIELTLQPQSTQWAAGSGAAVPPPPKQQNVTAAGFRLDLSGLPTAHVASIDAFAVEQPATRGAVGRQAAPVWAPGTASFPNLTASIAETDLQQWAAWFDGVVKGAPTERDGAIVLLAQDLKTEVLRVGLHGVGIRALRHAPYARGADAVRRLSAELYCQEMTFATAAKPFVKPGGRVVTPLRR